MSGAAPAPGAAPRGTVAEVAAAFLKLGVMSFGGPIAHLGYFRAEVVERRKWIDDASYGDLVALCQFLPGPASSQVVFALGMRRAGLAGALAASSCFTLPSAALMIAFAYGLSLFTEVDLAHAGWLHGLKLAAVVVVAQAVWGMAKKLCPDKARASLALVAAAVLLVVPGWLARPAVLAVLAGGGGAGFLLYRRAATDASARAPSSSSSQPPLRAHVAAASALALFFVLLLALPAIAVATGSPLALELDAFYRAGALVFGGGHVVLPLLRDEVVPRGWLSDDAFLAGYGAAQALPGPLFTFSAYLGTAMATGPNRWRNGLWCLLSIFLPAWLLIGGALPFWHGLQAKQWVRAALAGASAAVVGVLLAALYDPVMREGVRDARDVAAALVAFGLLERWKTPPFVVVAALAAAGQWLLTGAPSSLP